MKYCAKKRKFRNSQHYTCSNYKLFLHEKESTVLQCNSETRFLNECDLSALYLIRESIFCKGLLVICRKEAVNELPFVIEFTANNNILSTLNS